MVWASRLFSSSFVITQSSELLRDYVAVEHPANGEIETVPGPVSFSLILQNMSGWIALELLIDSATLEAGGDVDKSFRDAHAIN